MEISLRLAGPDDEAVLLALVGEYHAFEGVTVERADAVRALAPLLGQEDAGRIWLVEQGSEIIGYIAICFGYSIEFGGRDAFVDEFFLKPERRGRGIGGVVLEDVAERARALGLRALHLEVDRTNERARRLYASSGFASRERFHLMSRVL